MLPSEGHKRNYREYTPKEGGDIFVRVYPENFLPLMDVIILKHFESKPKKPKTDSENNMSSEKKRKRIKKTVFSSDKPKK